MVFLYVPGTTVNGYHIYIYIWNYLPWYMSKKHGITIVPCLKSMIIP